ncbi:MAG: ABC transporter substrate binding protein [Gammaproteobacteria bacterium]|nr:ABC transporter substrate binding protein [Gammaproteobacteria bacterium]
MLIALRKVVYGVGFLILALMPLQPVLAQQPVAVVYPQVDERFQFIFAEMLKGIESVMGEPVRSYVLPAEYQLDDLDHWLDVQDIDTVIALGGSSSRALAQLNGLVRVVYGGTDLSVSRGGSTGISLMPDPKLLFERLRSLAPEIETVTVIYSMENNACLIEKAQQEARDSGLTLEAIPAGSMKEAAGYYRRWLKQLDVKKDALWLPMDRITVDQSRHFSNLLSQAWEREFVIFSSTSVHAKRGALFSLYADHNALGKSLARMARRQLQQDAGDEGIRPLLEVKSALNRRTADHLGLRLVPRQIRSFDLLFPRRY